MKEVNMWKGAVPGGRSRMLISTHRHMRTCTCWKMTPLSQGRKKNDATTTEKKERNAQKRSKLKSVKELNGSPGVRTGACLICPAIKNTEAAEGSLARPSIPQTICFPRMEQPNDYLQPAVNHKHMNTFINAGFFFFLFNTCSSSAA